MKKRKNTVMTEIALIRKQRRTYKQSLSVKITLSSLVAFSQKFLKTYVSRTVWKKNLRC